jgi:hypothetical protein
MQNLIKELSEPVITPSGIRAPTALMLRAAKAIQHLNTLNNSASRTLQQLQSREMTVLDDTDPISEYKRVMNEEYTSNLT